jgi:hypothetical protein
VKSGSGGKLENPCRGRLESADCDCSVPKSGIAGKFNPPRAELKSGRGGKSALFTLMSGKCATNIEGKRWKFHLSGGEIGWECQRNQFFAANIEPGA